MANRDIFDFLHSNEIDYINVDTGVVVVFHGNYVNGRTYKPGSMVRFIDGGLVYYYIAIRETNELPSIRNSWELLTDGFTATFRSVITSDGNNLVDSDGNYVKTI